MRRFYYKVLNWLNLYEKYINKFNIEEVYKFDVFVYKTKTGKLSTKKTNYKKDLPSVTLYSSNIELATKEMMKNTKYFFPLNNDGQKIEDKHIRFVSEKIELFKYKLEL